MYIYDLAEQGSDVSRKLENIRSEENAQNALRNVTANGNG